MKVLRGEIVGCNEIQLLKIEKGLYYKKYMVRVSLSRAPHIPLGSYAANHIYDAIETMIQIKIKMESNSDWRTIISDRLAGQPNTTHTAWRGEKVEDYKSYKHFSNIGPLKKPPIAIRPKFVVDEHRVKEIFEGIQRFMEKHKSVPNEWIEELKNIVCAK